MNGCTVQMYPKSPSVAKTCSNVSSVSRPFEAKLLSLPATLCGVSSRLVQTTRVPGAIVMSLGANVNFEISSATLGADEAAAA